MKRLARWASQRWKRWVVGTIAVVFLTWLLGTFAITWTLTRRPRAMQPEISPPAALAAEDLKLATRDGETLGAWMIRGEPGRPALVLLHGLGGSRRNFLALMTRLKADGCTVLAISMRGHGDSTGDSIDFGYSSRADVVAAMQHVRANTAAGTKVIVVGTSLGSGAAMFAAKELATQVDGYLLESPFKDLETATQNRLKMRLSPPIAAIVHPGLHMWARVLLPVDPDRISPCEASAGVPKTTPVIILTGTKDRHATVREAEDICAVVASHGKVIKFPNGKHATLYGKDPERYYRALQMLMEPRLD